MKTIQSFLTLISCVLASGPLLFGEAVEWIDSKRQDDVAYFLHNSTPRIERYNLGTEQWLTAINLSKIPTGFHVDAEYLYIGYDKSIYRYDHNGASETHLGNFTTTVNDLFTDGDLLFVFHQGVEVVSRVNGSKIDTSETDNYYLRLGISHYPENRRFYGRSGGISPSDISYLSYDENGAVLTINDSPHHGDFDHADQTWVWPDGSKVGDDSGNVYDALSLQHLNSFGTDLDSLDFHGIDIPIGVKGTRLSAFSKALLETGYKNLSVSPKTIYVIGEKVIGFYTSDSSSNGIDIVSAGLDELNADEPGAPVLATELAFTPDDSFLDKNNVLYLFSKIHSSLFQWDVVTQSWLETLPLLGGPDHVEYSPDNDRIYTAYNDGKIRYLDLTAEEPVEVPFANLPTNCTGLVACGLFLVASDNSGAWASYRSFAEDGTQLDWREWNYPLNQAQWSPTHRRIYHFRDSQSPNDLHWEGVSELGTFDGEGETDLHGDVGTVYPIRIHPDSTLILLGSGKMYDAVSMASLNTLSESLEDATWLSGELFTLHENAIKTWTLPTYGEGASTTFLGQPNRLITTLDDKLLLITIDEAGIPRISIYDSEYDLIAPAVIPAPTLNLVRRSASAASIEWTNVSGEEQFFLERKTGESGTWESLETLGMDVTAFTDMTVVTGAVYFYRVKAENDGLESAYSNEIEVDLVYDPIDATPIDAPELPFTPDKTFIDNSNVLYLFSKEHQSLFRWDISQQMWIVTIPLRGAPDFVSYSPINHVIYTAYNDGKIFALNLSGSPLVEVAFANLATNPRGLVSAGEYIIGSDNSGAWESHTSFAPDGSKIDYADWNYPLNEAVWNEETRRIYHFRDGTSPNDLLSSAINVDGTLGEQIDSPYHSSDGIRYPIRVKPDGTIVLLGSGRIYDAITLEQLNSLPNILTDATWLGGELFVLEESKIIHYQLPTYSPGPEFNLSDPGIRVLTTTSNKLLVISINEDGRPQMSVLESDLTVTAPDSFPKPEMELLEISSTSVKVAWKDVNGENEYLLQRKTGMNGSWSEIGTTAANVTEFSDTTVSLSQTYFYRVAAKNGDLVSEYSDELLVGMFAPGVVTNAQAFALSESEVLVSWDSVDYASGYRIERKSDSGNWQMVGEVGSMDSDFNDTSVSKGTEYFYRVTALSGIQNAAPSSETMITTPIDPPQSPNFLETTVVGALRIDLSWTDVEDEQNYLLERSEPNDDPNNWAIVALLYPGLTSFTDQGVNAETDYVYRISASNIGGSSNPTLSNTLTTPELTPPTVPVFSANQLTGNQVKVSWETVLDAQVYKVYRRSIGETTWQLIEEVDGQSTEYVDTSGAIGDNYQYSIIASNASGDSLRSTTLNVEMVERLLVLHEDFEDELDDDVWSPTTQGFIISPGAAGSGQAMIFDDHERAIFSRPLYIHAGGSIQFHLRSGPGEGYPWNKPEEGDDLSVALWNGFVWEDVELIDLSDQVYDDWQIVTIDLPDNFGGQEYILSLQQIRYSSSGDQWGIDNISVYSHLPPVPEPPDFVSTQMDNEGAILTLWTGSQHATSYKVERRTDSSSWTEVAHVMQPDCHFRDLDVVGSITYYYRVFAVNDGGISLEASEPTDGSTEPNLIATREAGQQDVLDSPGDFGLVSVEEVADARDLGRSDILFFPAIYDLHTVEELQNAVIEGQNNVMNNPGPFGLYDYHTSHVYVGETVTTHNGDFAALEWSLYRSFDLTNWELLRADILFELQGDDLGTFFQLNLEEQ